jgi:hypothetical protein
MSPSARPVEQELGETRRRIERLVDALAGGPEDLPSVRAALAGLERQRGRLEGQLAALARQRRQAEAESVEATVDRLLEALADLRALLTVAEPEQRKGLVREFLAGIRIETRTRQAFLTWNDLPRQLLDSAILVELRGVGHSASAVEAVNLPPGFRRPGLRRD